MLYGYVRVSSKVQLDGYGLEAQKQEIQERYKDQQIIIYEEQYTGTKVQERPILTELLSKIQKGDTLIVTKLDRLARNVVEGRTLIDNLLSRGIYVHVLQIGLLENTTMGLFVLNTLLAVAEMERNTIIERTQRGKEIAKQNPSYKEGRPKKYSPEHMDGAMNLLKTHSYSQVSIITSIPISTLKTEARRRKELGLIKEWEKKAGRPKKAQ